MNILAALIAASLSWSAPASDPTRLPEAAPSAVKTARPRYWLKLYPLSPYKEKWNIAIEMSDFTKDMPKLLKAFEKEGARLRQPIETFPASVKNKTQQLSYNVSLKGAKRLAKNMKKFGRVAEPIVHPELERAPAGEVKEKIFRLNAAKREGGGALAAIPAAAELVDELLEHLLQVEAVSQRADAEVLLNVSVSQRP